MVIFAVARVPVAGRPVVPGNLVLFKCFIRDYFSFFSTYNHFVDEIDHAVRAGYFIGVDIVLIERNHEIDVFRV